MTIETALYSHLAADNGVKALVVARIYPDQLPQQPTLPALTYTRVSTAPVNQRSSAKPTFSRARFQVDCWDDDRDGAGALRAAVRTAMGGIAQASSPRIDVALLADDRDLVEPATGRYRATLDYYIWHEEA